MIIPSIDLQEGRAVQLVGGRDLAVDGGAPEPWARRFGRVGLTAVVDLDAARGRGDNTAAARPLLDLAPCTVGGGIRDLATARRWLDAGAQRVVLGTAATPELLAELPPERVIVALDARHGKVLSHGWQTSTAATVEQRMAELRPLAGGFLVTTVEREGRLGGIDLDRARELKAVAGDRHLIVAGGVASPADVGRLDALGIDAQVGMALYTDAFHEADAVAACLRSDRPDGLWPTVICNQQRQALGLAWSDAESLRTALESGRGVYRSRRRGLWVKGETSGDHQDLLRVELDCDRDCLRFVVHQHGAGFCHLGSAGCFGDHGGLTGLQSTLARRRTDAPAGSYTRRLLDDPVLLSAKLREEAGELAAARTPSEVAHEAADVLFFTLTAMTRAGVTLADVEAVLDRRALALTRRPGHAKPDQEAAS